MMPRPISRKPPSPARHGAPPAARLSALGEQVRVLSSQGDHEGALRAALQALSIVPGHPVALGDVALCQMRLGRFDEARQRYMLSLKVNPTDENVLDGLAECSGRLGLLEEAAALGRRALEAKAALVASEHAWPLLQCPPKPFEPRNRKRNVVAFSLFGTQPRYGETAVLNVTAAAELLPAWICRFHVDTSVPEHVIKRLIAGGAEVVQMGTHPAKDAHPLTWRFLVIDDPAIDRFLLRDADSLISIREVAAIQAWLDSPRWFHLMRDWYTHTELLLAGMWGGCTGAFRDVQHSLIAYSRQPPRLGRRLIDQHWLRHHAWPTVRQSVLAHDRLFRFDDAGDFPAHAPVDLGEDFHVGANISGNGIGGSTPQADGSAVNWRLVDESGNEVCRYASTAQGGRWEAALPLPYTRAIASKRWRCLILTS